jgi:ABC-2 type transport system permease protein
VKVVTIAALSLRRLLRDRVGLFFVLIFPVVITTLIGFAVFSGSFDTIDVGILNRSEGPLSDSLIEQLTKAPSLEVEHFKSREDLDTAVRRNTIAAGLIIPPDYDEALTEGEQVEVLFIPSPRRGSPAAVQSQVGSFLTGQGVLVRAATFASREGAGDFSENLKRAEELRPQDTSAVTATFETIGKREDDSAFQGFTYPSASNLVLFVFITSLTASSQLIEARRSGIALRMVSTPTSARAVMLGSIFGRFAIALFQGLFIFVVGTLLFDVKWGDPLGTAALIFLFCLVATGIAMLAGAVLRTPEQAGLGVPLGIGLGMLGGCMWPLEIVGPTMRAVGHATPHAWAMDGFISLLRGNPVSDITTELTVLAAFALGLISLSLPLFRRKLVG